MSHPVNGGDDQRIPWSQFRKQRIETIELFPLPGWDAVNGQGVYAFFLQYFNLLLEFLLLGPPSRCFPGIAVVH